MYIKCIYTYMVKHTHICIYIYILFYVFPYIQSYRSVGLRGDSECDNIVYDADDDNGHDEEDLYDEDDDDDDDADDVMMVMMTTKTILIMTLLLQLMFKYTRSSSKMKIFVLASVASRFVSAIALLEVGVVSSTSKCSVSSIVES